MTSACAASLLAEWRHEIGEVQLEQQGAALSAAQLVTVDARRSLAITDEPMLAGFSFKRVMDQLVSQARVPGLRLVAGGPPFSESLIERLGLSDRVVQMGRVDATRIPSLLGAADVCLLPFHTVPATEHIVPIKLYEYMAAGKPVIAAPLPGVMRDVGDQHGVVYAPADQQIEKALAIREQAGAMGRAARAFVEAHCDWNVVTDEFEQRLEAHVAGHR